MLVEPLTPQEPSHLPDVKLVAGCIPGVEWNPRCQRRCLTRLERSPESTRVPHRSQSNGCIVAAGYCRPRRIHGDVISRSPLFEELGERKCRFKCSE
jgi:hypothetical protein